ncbi:MAG: CDP-diacylglycerol--serine O-phosphatidyltransferase [Elusimicrobia bacterium]|nr:CDP-diacylglycerol--serine O-phosphatidyltransferase [Elusimicrobiota bacterium]
MDRVKLKRSGQVLAPSLFTMGNMACGYYALMASNHADFAAAATAILAGIVFDMLDGRVARLVRGESTFGVEFDSLSDFLSFGVAPAYMMYSFTLKDYGAWGMPLSFVFALAGGLRLARFNAVAHAGTGSKTHFQGLPIPAGAGFLASFVLIYDLVENRPERALGALLSHLPVVLVALAPFVVVALSLLMVSSIPYAAFKQVKLLERKNLPLLLAVAGVLALVYLYPQNGLFLIFLLYVVSGLTGLTGRPDKSPSAHPEPRDPAAPGPI